MPDLPPVHMRRTKSTQAALDKARRNQQKRQYHTGSTTWRRIRAWILSLEPLCRECHKRGRITPATDVDHIDGDSWHNTRQNLQSLCHECHSRKTALEQRTQ